MLTSSPGGSGDGTGTEGDGGGGEGMGDGGDEGLGDGGDGDGRLASQQAGASWDSDISVKCPGLPLRSHGTMHSQISHSTTKSIGFLACLQCRGSTAPWLRKCGTHHRRRVPTTRVYVHVLGSIALVTRSSGVVRSQL